MPPFVALTGGIGAGKSTALACLERLGAAVISSDAVVHELYGSSRVIDAVVGRFGPQVAPDRVVDRGELAAHVFAADEDRQWLEQLLWPLVRTRIAQWRAEMSARDPQPKALVVEVPLLFEAGMDHTYDATIAVIAPEELRAERAAGRGHRAVDQRSARQLTQEEKAQRATYAVVNDGAVEVLEARLAGVIADLTNAVSPARNMSAAE